MKISDAVFVYRHNNHIVGMVTLKVCSDVAIIGLIAANSKLRGKRIGSSLLTQVEKYVFERGINYIEVATQYDNKLACSFYKKNDYRIKEITNYYHIWKKDYENTF